MMKFRAKIMKRKCGRYLGSGEVPLPGGGREVWLLGRGGGQQSSYDSCLVRKSHLSAGRRGGPEGARAPNPIRVGRRRHNLNVPT